MNGLRGQFGKLWKPNNSRIDIDLERIETKSTIQTDLFPSDFLGNTEDVPPVTLHPSKISQLAKKSRLSIKRFSYTTPKYLGSLLISLKKKYIRYAEWKKEYDHQRNLNALERSEKDVDEAIKSLRFTDNTHSSNVQEEIEWRAKMFKKYSSNSIIIKGEKK